jgi:formate dehydrogenase subunit gamma
MAVAADRINDIPAHSDRVLRHAAIDRLFHWLTAVCVLTLMATGLLPHVGVQFDWVGIHWIAGLTLVALVIFHVLRSAVWRKLRAMWFSVAELRTHQVGKYSVAQKLMHHAMTLMVLGAAITGVLMLKKIRTPLLVRDPYLFDAHTWGIIYVIHGLAALSAITLVIVHVYFGIIPENRMYLRAMITGWMSRGE